MEYTIYVSEWVSEGVNMLLNELLSEWVCPLLNTKWPSIQLYHGENKLHVDEMMMMSILY